MVFDIRKYDLEGNYINDAQFFLDEIETRDIIQGYETEYVYEIIRKMVNKISELQNKMYLMPVLTEFFMVYLASYRNFEIRKKKNFLVVD